MSRGPPQQFNHLNPNNHQSFGRGPGGPGNGRDHGPGRRPYNNNNNNYQQNRPPPNDGLPQGIAHRHGQHGGGRGPPPPNFGARQVPPPPSASLAPVPLPAIRFDGNGGAQTIPIAPPVGGGLPQPKYEGAGGSYAGPLVRGGRFPERAYAASTGGKQDRASGGPRGPPRGEDLPYG
ncbi:hypothetical protein FRC02_002820 [Tulasnella sp. 418]|nr:hypothetical protein FRC02_002820 [Tulasnella sp. 418]